MTIDLTKLVVHGFWTRPLPSVPALTTGILVAASVLLTMQLRTYRVQAQTSAGFPAIDAKIESVWPHDQLGNPVAVGQAPLVNVEIYLFQRGGLDPLPCRFAGTPQLHYALNWEIYGQGHGIGGEVVADELVGRGLEPQFSYNGLPSWKPPQPPVAQPTKRTVNGRTFPAWVFNDVPVGPFGPYIMNQHTYFFVDMPGYDVRTSVWGHGSDPRSFQPEQIIPAVTADGAVKAIESIIQVVVPHDQQGNQVPASQAPLADISVDLFRYPLFLSGEAALANPSSSPESVSFSWSPAPQLLRALNSGYLAPVEQPAKQIQETRTNYSHPVSWPRWTFKDVDVSGALIDPLNKYYFTVGVQGIENHTTVWAHGADSGTIPQQRDIPTSGGAGC